MKIMNLWTALARFASFETPRLICRPIRFDDAPAFFTISSNPQNARYILPPGLDRATSDQLLVETFMRQPLGVWALTLKPSDQLIGLLRFERLDGGNGRAEVAYVLNQPHWGQGLMTEAVKTLTFLAFQEFGLKELSIICHLDNLASQKVAQKAGYLLKKRYRGRDRYQKTITDYLSYQLTRRHYRYE